MAEEEIADNDDSCEIDDDEEIGEYEDGGENGKMKRKRKVKDELKNEPTPAKPTKKSRILLEYLNNLTLNFKNRYFNFINTHTRDGMRKSFPMNFIKHCIEHPTPNITFTFTLQICFS